MDKFSHVLIENLVIEKTCFSDTVTMQHCIALNKQAIF